MTSPTQSSPGSNKVTPKDFWVPPVIGNDTYRTGLMLNNSMVGEKTEFIPAGPGKQITWYGCGPTVYDAAHMGHARTYLCFDIMRRVLRDYFGYNILMCMNITDIDDKIIQRSREKNVDFESLARYWEAMFWDDMRALNIELPDVVTRVSEYVPEVIRFIQGILENGFAYMSEGSVYFDTQAFRASPSHVYGRMEPFSVNDQARVLEGEGDLGIVTEKKCPLDFALWKKAKEGEPFWESPWGRGRPGWHIECSAMASEVLGFPVDIHSGGIDLRFPHHDNELAQSEARYNRPQWVNYFLHAGHLHIKGSKMSKSLKNFITIKECLATFSSRALRLLTLSHRWDAPMNYSPDGESMCHASDIDQGFVNFFGTVQAFLRSSLEYSNICEALSQGATLNTLDLGGLLDQQSWDEVDRTFHSAIQAAQNQVDVALKDNLDTPTVLTTLRSLVTDVHVYLKRDDDGRPKCPLVVKSACFIFRLLKIFGLTNGNEVDLNYIGAAEGGSLKAEANLMDCLSAFRGEIRETAQRLLKVLRSTTVDNGVVGKENNDVPLELVKSLLSRCDALRDGPLIELGIQLEDMPEGSIWKKSTREELLRERERKEAAEERKQLQKEELRRAQEEQRSRKQQEARIPPEEYYNETRPGAFLQFDPTGVPMTNADGTAVTKSQRDKMRKFLEKHTAAHTTWLKSQ